MVVEVEDVDVGLVWEGLAAPVVVGKEMVVMMEYNPVHRIPVEEEGELGLTRRVRLDNLAAPASLSYHLL